ncbi:hypothetical protein JOM56_012205 [Amanita muscaria]
MPRSTVAVAQSASAGYLTEILQNAKQALLASGYYLGTPEEKWAEKVTWRRVGKAERLVTIEADATAAAAYKVFEESGQEGKAPSPPEPAMLSAVVHVSEDNYWLTSCGMWRGSSAVAQSLADVKPTCVGVAPAHTVFTEDFRFGVIIGGANRRIKFRHVLFEAISSRPESEPVVPGEYTITQWPTFYSEAREELQTMIATH